MKKWKESELAKLFSSRDGPRVENSVVQKMTRCCVSNEGEMGRGDKEGTVGGFAWVVMLFPLLSRTP